MTEPLDATRSNASLAALLLTNRLAAVGAKPFTSSEFWRLVGSCDQLDGLLTADVAGIASRAGVEEDEAVRIRTLLDASRAFAFERERLEDGGIVLVSPIDPSFPASLVERLGSSCPSFLLVAGPIEWVAGGGLGMAGSRNDADQVLDVARDAARAAVERDWPVITGLAEGVDRIAIEAAASSGGRCVGVPAEGINVVSRRADIRRLVHDRRLCLVSPYAPNSRSSAASAVARSKIIYALSTATFVVSTDAGSGSSRAGAGEALQRGWCPVATWTGPGAGDGNAALVAQGAHPIRHVDQLFEPMAIAPTDHPQPSLF